MFNLFSLASLIWLSLCGISGWLAGATIIRVSMPVSMPDKFASMPATFKMKINAGGFGGLFLAVLLGVGLLWLDAFFANADGVVALLIRVLLFIVSWAWLGTMLAFAVVVNDYHEVLVAMYDFSGAPWLMGGTLGGAMGGILGIIRLGGEWWLGLLWGAGGGMGGAIIGFLVGVVLMQVLRQYMLKLRAQQNI